MIADLASIYQLPYIVSVTIKMLLSVLMLFISNITGTTLVASIPVKVLKAL